jgi:hypothetical protein
MLGIIISRNRAGFDPMTRKAICLCGAHEAGVRGNRLPSAFPPHERIREADNDVVRSGTELADAASPSGDDSGISEHPHIDVIDLEAPNLVYPRLEDIAEHSGSIGHTAIRSGASPVRGDDPLECGAVAIDPGSGQRLL